MFHPELPQIGLDAVEDVRHGFFIAHVLTLCVRQVHQAGVGGEHLTGDVDDVVALVILFRPGDGAARQLLCPQPDRKAQQAHLAASVVDIIFRIHMVARPAQEPGQAVAHGGPAPVPHVQRPRGIGRNVLQQHLAPAARRAFAVGRAFGLHGAHHSVPVCRAESHVAETRSGGFGGGHVRAARQQFFGQIPGQIARIGLGLLGQEQGQVGGKVAVSGLARGLNDGFGGPGQAFFFNNGLEGRAQGFCGAHKNGCPCAVF